MATVVLLTRVNLKEESMLLLPEMSFVPTEGDSFPRLISPEAHRSSSDDPPLLGLSRVHWLALKEKVQRSERAELRSNPPWMNRRSESGS